MTPESNTYATCRIKRERATVREMAARRSALLKIVASAPPMTVRQVFYQATVHGLVDKTEAGYDKVQRELVKLRSTGDLPFRWIADLTRWQRRPTTFDGPGDALRETARLYRKSLWATAESRVEIWLEKDALSGVIVDVTAESDVPLMVTRGYPSLTFLAAAADQIRAMKRPTFIYHLGDFDPSGQDAARVRRNKAARVGAPRRDTFRTHRRDADAGSRIGTSYAADQIERLARQEFRRGFS